MTDTAREEDLALEHNAGSSAKMTPIAAQRKPFYDFVKRGGCYRLPIPRQ